MTNEEFLCFVKESVKEMIGEESTVNIHKVLKNNDIEMDALTILSKDSNVSPTIYLNSYYKDYCDGKDEGEIVNEIVNLYDEHRNQITFDVEMFRDFDRIKNRIAYKLINAKSNKRLLSEVPHKIFMDLAIVYYCLVDSEYLGSATALIHNVHMDMWNVELDELHNVAKDNTPRILQYDLRNMNDVIREILINDLEQNIYEKDDRYDSNCNIPSAECVADGLLKDIKESKNPIQMYVLTNRQKTNGAACMLYENVLKEFADIQNADLFILPSSIHEVILVPAVDQITTEELTQMVKDVNNEELDAGEVLSDHVYIYRRDEDKIAM